MRKAIIVVIILVAGAGGGAAYYYIGHRATGNELSAAIPADTLIYERVTDSKRFVERMVKLQSANGRMLDAQIQQYRKLAPQIGDVGLLLVGLYDAATEQRAKGRLLPGVSQTAFYTVGLVPVMRFQLSDPAAFRRFLDEAEKRGGVRGKSGSFQGVAYRTYGIQLGNGRPAATTLLVAIRSKFAVVTLDVPQFRAESLPLALGLKAPAQSLAHTDLTKRVFADAGPASDSVGFLNHAAIVAALVGAPGSLAGTMLTQVDTGHLLGPVRTPACQRDLQGMAKVWPMTVWGTRLGGGRGSGVTARTKMLSEITDAPLAAQLVKLRGHIPPPVMDSSAEPMLVTAVGLDVSSVGSVVGALQRRFMKADFQCEWLVKAQQQLAKSNPAVVSMATGLFGSVKGISVSVFDLQTVPNGSGGTKLQSVDALLTVSVEQPARLIGLLKAMQPQLLGNINIPPDGTAVPLQLPGVATGATVRIIGNNIALYDGAKAEQAAQKLTGDDLAPDGVGYYHIDYGKLSKFLVGRLMARGLGKGLSGADLDRFKQSLQRMGQTKMRFDVKQDFTNNGVVMDANMAAGDAQ